MRFFGLVATPTLVGVLTLSATTIQSATLSPLTSFGNGDGWRAPNEIVVGDTPGTATGPNYNYLQTGSLERGLDYNPVTDNLILVSRSGAGQGIRRLDGITGADEGAVVQPPPGTITGGTFTISTVGVADDGAIYVANLQTNAASSAFKIYRWASEGSSIDGTPYFNSTIAGFTGTPRLGDSLDITGAGASTKIVAGASGVLGYAVIDSGGATAVASFATPSATLGAGDFRLGVTFAQDANNVWGKQTGTNQNLEQTSYAGSAGTSIGAVSIGESLAAMDYAVIGGKPVLAVANMNTTASGLPTVFLYDVSNPLSPVLLTSGTTASGSVASNGNGVGSVAWGKRTGPGAAILYAMVTNQGIQAFQVTNVPEPGGFVLFALGAALLPWIRSRR